MAKSNCQSETKIPCLKECCESWTDDFKNYEKQMVKVLTTKRAKVLKKKRMYPVKLRLLVSIFDSLCASIAIVTSANGWYTRVSTLAGW